jgi:hypothetical protein
MKRIFRGLIISVLLISGMSYTAHAATNITAHVRGEHAVAVDKALILDASESVSIDQQRDLTYTWDFGDGNSDQGIEVVHTYREPGAYKVTLTINDGVEEAITIHEIFSYNKAIVLISDDKEKQQRIESLMEYSRDFGVQLDLIESFSSASQFISEEVLLKKLDEHPEIITRAKEILIWSKTGSGLQALSRFLRENKENGSLSEKDIIIMQDELPNIPYAERQFRALNPEKIILVKEAAIYPLIETQNNDIFIEKLKKGNYEFKIINELSERLRPLLFVSYMVNILIETGIPENTLALILLLPVIATVVSFMKQVIGITTLGIYTPSIFTLIFLTLGLQFSLLALFVILMVGVAGRFLLRKLRLLYIPKLAIVISMVSFMILILLLITTRLNIFDTQFIALAIFPVMIMVTLTEKFINVQKEKGLSATILLVVETVIVAIIAYFIAGGPINMGFATIQWEFIRNLMINYPEFIFILIIINILLGRWTGLRLFEYIRFREILKQVEE